MQTQLGYFIGIGLIELLIIGVVALLLIGGVVALVMALGSRGKDEQ